MHGVLVRFRLLMPALVLLVASGCGSDTVSPPADPPEFASADGVNGGQLYDKFWSSETGWNQNDPNLTTFNSSSDFFRCKQCHGWDLLGNKGAYISRSPSTTRPNVSGLDLRQIAASKTAQELFNAMMAATDRRSVTADLSTYDPTTNPTVGDQMPDYSQIFSAGQMWEIVKFLKSEAIDVSVLYDASTTGTYPTGSITFSNHGKDGSASNGDVIFSNRCSACHGIDGGLILLDNNGYTAGSFVRQKSNEAQHKIKFGQLGTGMVDMGLDVDEVKDIYKALSNETKYPAPGSPTPPELAAADGVRGGRLYDKFWESDAGWNQSDPNLGTFNANADFFRCKHCHGWDRLGNQGAYISRTPRTTRPNVDDLNLAEMVTNATPTQLFDAIKSQTSRRLLTADLSTYDPATNPTVGDQMPNYAEIMSDSDIWDLVKFLKYYAYDTALLYDSATTGTYPNGSISFSSIGKDGDAAAGAMVYASKCATCHGNDGRLTVVDGEFSVGSYTRAKPNEAHHKFRYGVLGTAMINLGLDFTDIKNLYKALSDASAFPDPVVQARQAQR